MMSQHFKEVCLQRGLFHFLHKNIFLLTENDKGNKSYAFDSCSKYWKELLVLTPLTWASCDSFYAHLHSLWGWVWAWHRSFLGAEPPRIAGTPSSQAGSARAERQSPQEQGKPNLHWIICLKGEIHSFPCSPWGWFCSLCWCSLEVSVWNPSLSTGKGSWGSPEQAATKAWPSWMTAQTLILLNPWSLWLSLLSHFSTPPSFLFPLLSYQPFSFTLLSAEFTAIKSTFLHEEGNLSAAAVCWVKYTTSCLFL